MRLPLHIFTLALDSFPWIAVIYSDLMRLNDVPWTWTICHGAAMNNGSTKWMTKQSARLSSDGTTEFLAALAYHPRIRVIERQSWNSKDEMVNAAVDTFKEPGVLFQQDSDELHGVDNYRRVVELFEDDPALMLIRFDCDYMLGANVRTTDRGKPDEWLRAWRWAPGMKFISHEPPNLADNKGKTLSREQTASLALRFQHHAWTLPKHVEQKQRLYGKRFEGALDGWKKLQANMEWPLADAGRFLPVAFKGTPCDQVFK